MKKIHSFTKKTSSSSVFRYWSEPVKVSCAVWISYNGDFRAILLFSEDHPAMFEYNLSEMTKFADISDIIL